MRKVDIWNGILGPIRFRGCVLRSSCPIYVPGCVLYFTLFRCPQGQVVAQELHDESRVLVRLFGESVELSYRVVESLSNQESGKEM